MLEGDATENLRAELRSLADALEEVLSSSGDKSKEEMSEIRSKAGHALREDHHRLSETSDVIVRQTREATARADSYVHENPRTGIGIGAAVGVVLGILLLHR